MSQSKSRRARRIAKKHTATAQSPAVVIHPMAIPKARFLELPRSERAFVLMLGHIGNELSMLQKLMWYASNFDHPPGMQRDVHSSQSLFVGKILTGKLKEAWEFIRGGFLSTPLGKTWRPLLDDEARKALDSLQTYFGKQTLFDRIRDDFIFHYSSKGDWEERLDAAYAKLRDVESVFYVSKSRANSHALAGEITVNLALLEAIEPGDPGRSLDRLITETLDVASWMTDFAEHCTGIMLERHFGRAYLADQLAREVPLTEIADPTKVRLPFFVQPKPIPD